MVCQLIKLTTSLHEIVTNTTATFKSRKPKLLKDILIVLDLPNFYTSGRQCNTHNYSCNSSLLYQQRSCDLQLETISWQHVRVNQTVAFQHVNYACALIERHQSYSEMVGFYSRAKAWLLCNVQSQVLSYVPNNHILYIYAIRGSSNCINY